MKKIYLTGLILVITGVLFMVAKQNSSNDSTFYQHQVSPKSLSKDAVILDVRNGSEHAEISLVRPHYFVELSKLNPDKFMKEHKLGDKTLHILCKSGKRATKAAQMFEDAGYKNVAIIAGGMDNVKASKLEVYEQEVISLERQVRIAAGFLVLAGVLLGLFISPYFYLIPLFVGSGLIYAGVSNSCGMAVLLSMMPWNK